MKNRASAALIIGLVILARSAAADQLQCNSKADAERAARVFAPGSMAIEYCSMCEGSAKVVRVASAKVIADCEFEVVLSGTVIAESRSFAHGYDATRPAFQKRAEPFEERLDLAYVYVEVAPNDFRWVGGQLALQAEVVTSQIKLPTDLYAALGDHPLAKTQGAPPATAVESRPAAAPDTATVRRVFDYFARGGPEGAILVRVLPCLDVDSVPGRASYGDCTRPATSAPRRGTNVFAWSEWLLPAQDEGRNLTVQFALNGSVVATRELSFRAKSMPARAWASAFLDKAGRWELIVKRGANELGRAQLDIND
jgi:hypothetical protein